VPCNRSVFGTAVLSSSERKYASLSLGGQEDCFAFGSGLESVSENAAAWRCDDGLAVLKRWAYKI
jgi:hypothetical protein